MSTIEHKQKIWNFIKDIKVGMLTTNFNDNFHSRPMHLVQDDYDGTIWFFTKLDSAKVKETLLDHDVALTFSCPKDDTYVAMYGKANICKDQNLIDNFWNKFIAAWFPEGKDSENVALLEIKINSGEHWDSNSNKLVQLFKIAKANINKTTPNIGENETF